MNNKQDGIFQVKVDGQPIKQYEWKAGSMVRELPDLPAEPKEATKAPEQTATPAPAATPANPEVKAEAKQEVKQA